MSVKSFIAEGLREIFVEGAFKALRDSGKKALERATTKITDEHRSELWIFLSKLSDQDAVNIFRRRYQKTLLPPRGSGVPGDENRFVDLLTRLYLTTKELADPEWIFLDLAHLTDSEFDEALYFLEHDVLPQWFGKAKIVLGDAFAALDSRANVLAGGLAKFRKELAKRGVK